MLLVVIYSDFLVEMFLHFFGIIFSSGILFVEIFLQIFLVGRCLYIKRLFGRDVFFVCKMSLQSFLGIICERNSGREIV